jgi:hypothetical protein
VFASPKAINYFFFVLLCVFVTWWYEKKFLAMAQWRKVFFIGSCFHPPKQSTSFLCAALCLRDLVVRKKFFAMAQSFSLFSFLSKF